MSPCSLVSCLSSASHFASLVWILLQTFHEGWGVEGKQSEIQWQLAPSLVFAQGHGQAVSPGTEGMLSWAARTEMTLGCLQHSLGVQMGVEKWEVWIKKAAQGFARNYQIEQTLYKTHNFSDERLVGLEIDRIRQDPPFPLQFESLHQSIIDAGDSFLSKSQLTPRTPCSIIFLVFVVDPSVSHLLAPLSTPQSLS